MILKRFKFSVIGNVLRAGITLLTSLFLANVLGPQEFGRLSFIIASFLAVAQIMDMGTSNALITFLSKDKNFKDHYRIYFIWLFLQLVIGIFIILILLPKDYLDLIWQGNSKLTLILGFIAILFQQNVWNSVARICESNKETKKLQIANVSIATLHFLLLLAFYLLNFLSVELVLSLISLEILIISIFLLRKIEYLIVPGKYTLSEFIENYKSYCLPLIPFTIISVICTFADSWIITNYSGYEQQAFFGVAMQLSVVSLIAAKSIINIAWNEFSELSYRNDKKKLEELYNNSIFYLYSGSLLISSLLLPWSKEIVSILLGSEYISSYLILSVFLLYPIDQVRGQITGTYLLAVEDTKATSIFGIAGGLLNLVFAFIVAGPGFWIFTNLDLGALGIALKLVILQFIFVNITMMYISFKYRIKLKLSFQLLLPISIIAALALKQALLYIMPSYIAIVVYIPIFILFFYLIFSFFTEDKVNIKKVIKL